VNSQTPQTPVMLRLLRIKNVICKTTNAGKH
jgi:hypothetical protein